MKKIKLVDFLEFVNFRHYTDECEYNTNIIRIYYPDKDNMSFDNLYSKDRFFEYGVYDYSYDSRKRFIQTINPFILNCFVSEIRCNSDQCLEVYLTDEENIEDKNLDNCDYYLEGYENKSDKSPLHRVRKVFVSSPLAGDYNENIKRAQQYCRTVLLQGYMPLAPHVYYTNFLEENNEVERQLGMDMGLRWLAECDEMWVFDKNGISKGMKVEIEMATKLNIPIKYMGEEYEG